MSFWASICAWSALTVASILRDQRNLRVPCLLSDRVLCNQGVVALQIHFRVFQQRLVFGQLGLGLFERHLVGARVDLGEEIALVDQLAFLETDFHQIAVDLGFYRNRRERGDGAELVNVTGMSPFSTDDTPMGTGAPAWPRPPSFGCVCGRGKYQTAAPTIAATNSSQKSRRRQERRGRCDTTPPG